VSGQADLKGRVGGLIARGAPPERIAAARAALDAANDERAIDDPAALARAARIVRIALQRRRLTLADLDGPGHAA
jgi:hypothetical protein